MRHAPRSQNAASLASREMKEVQVIFSSSFRRRTVVSSRSR
jgi:hypothetical protein